MLSRAGNGCVNDFSRTLSATVWEPLIPPSAVTVFSGGTEGVLSPHVTFIVKEPSSTGLTGSVGRTRTLEPHEVGTSEQSRQVSTTIRKMIEESGICKELVRLILIKCPLLTSTKLEAIRANGRTPITKDTYESMARSRYASAIGVACALDELDPSQADEAIQDGQCWSAKASCSSGAELDDCHIFILASSASGGTLRATSSYMEDAIDAGTVLSLLDLVKRDKGKIVQVFAKAEADPRGHIRGQRHTMNTDSDVHSTRHARAAVGGLIAGLVGDAQIYVSGGAEGQGPIGGGSLCVVYRV